MPSKDKQLFPSTVHEPGHDHRGAMLRDLFAGLAMAGVLANGDQPDYPKCYEHAQGMLDARPQDR